VQLALGDERAAIADYSAAIALNPNDAELYKLRGDVRQERGDISGALADYNQAIFLRPDYTAAYAARGLTYADVGDNQRAYDDLSLVVAVQEEAVDPDVLYQRGLSRLRLGDRFGARLDLEQAAARYLETGQAEPYRRTLNQLRSL
jgi:tetratricopeptide (TPR) repeat protein